MIISKSKTAMVNPYSSSASFASMTWSIVVKILLTSGQLMAEEIS
jgi:hypothetical protein